jgi:N-acetylmuramoyl-L-alanine amidase
MLYREENKRSKKKFIYISIHSDAWKTTKARGWSVFTSPGQTKSDIIAEHFAKKFKQIFRKERLRKDTKDGDLDFEARFWVLRKTIMPAILTENFFMTNPHECKNILMDNEGRRLIAKIHYESIIEIDRLKLIG